MVEIRDLSVFTWIDVLVQGSFLSDFRDDVWLWNDDHARALQIQDVSFGNLALEDWSVLLFIGVIHAFLIWYGDILITYALMGLLLLLFLRFSGSVLIGMGTTLYLLPQLVLVE